MPRSTGIAIIFLAALSCRSTPPEPLPPFSPATKTSTPSTVTSSSATGPDLKSPAAPAEPGKNVPAIKVDTVGYPPAWRKIVVFNVEPKRAAVFDVQGRSVLKIAADKAVERGLDPASKDRTWQVDISDLRTPGRYRVKDGSFESDWFEIRDDVYRSALVAGQKHFYFQRCRTPLKRPYAEWQGKAFTRKNACHVHADIGWDLSDYPKKKRKFKVDGGWHDAGNYEIYVATVAPTVQALLMAFEARPLRFADGDLNIPESNNKIPDLLDETAWGLRWLFSMQEPNGAFRSREAVMNYSELVPPDQEKSARWIAGSGTASTAKATAALAVCARVYKQYDARLARRCEQASRSGWAFLQRTPKRITVDGKGSPQPLWDDGNEYSKETGARLIAAVEVWRSFLGKDALAAAEKLLNDLDTTPDEFVHGAWANLSRWGVIGLAQDERVPKNIRNEARVRLLNAVSDFRVQVDRDGYRCASRPEDYDWGHNSNLLEKAHLLLVAAELHPGQDWLVQAARDQWHWILGRNPNGFSMITGVGSAPTQIYHTEWKAAPPPGYVVGGPNGKDMFFLAPGAPAKALLWDNPKPLRSGLPAHSLWHSDQRDLWDGGFIKEGTWDKGWWSVTEGDIYYNANYILVAAYMAG